MESVKFDPALEFPLNTLSKRLKVDSPFCSVFTRIVFLDITRLERTMSMNFTEFLREKQYLQNVSANTLLWYKHALNWLPSENPNATDLKLMVVKMREAGLKATGCNAAIRAINCYLHG
jgi:hypothetical protein